MSEKKNSKVSSLPKKRNSKASPNRKKLWIIISAVSVFILIAAAAAVYFYYIYYLKANFENNTFNKMNALEHSFLFNLLCIFSQLQ